MMEDEKMNTLQSDPQKEKEQPNKTVDDLIAVERKIHDVRKAVPTAEWATYIPNKEYGVTVSLPHGCFVTATMSYPDESGSHPHLYLDMISVNNDLKRNDIGTRLLKALIREAKAFGATTLVGNVTSAAALATRVKVCGKNNVRFFTKNLSERGTEMKLTFDEAKKLERLDCVVISDLSQVDASGFEKPIESK